MANQVFRVWLAPRNSLHQRGVTYFGLRAKTYAGIVAIYVIGINIQVTVVDCRE